MTRINALHNTTRSIAWGKRTWTKNAGTLFFAAVLIVCSVTVGCSSDKPKTVSSNQITAPQTPGATEPMPTPAPALHAENKPAPKKIVHRRPATVNYTDKAYGVTFEYPRRYAIETGDAATDLVASTPLPMNFVQPGGVALAAVELPETSFANTDFSSAFFNVSVHKTLTADQCTEFAVPEPKAPETQSQTCHPEDSASCGTKDPVAAVAGTDAKSQGAAGAPEAASSTVSTTTATTEAAPVATTQATPAASAAPVAPLEPQGSKLMLGDLELLGTEAVAGQGTRQSDSKYFHVYQNGACYEFALNVTTDASEDGIVKHVDRDKVFNRLEAILSTVKITPVAAPEVTAEAPKAPAAAVPAQ
jgi:hypothetical protein